MTATLTARAEQRVRAWKTGKNPGYSPTTSRFVNRQYSKALRRVGRAATIEALAELEAERYLRAMEEKQARLEAARYHALAALERFREKMAAARDEFYVAMQDHEDWLEVDMFGDDHRVLTLDEYCEKAE